MFLTKLRLASTIEIYYVGVLIAQVSLSNVNYVIYNDNDDDFV